MLQRIAPLELAREWDNVGLLVEPVPAGLQAVSAVLLTIDLTDPVLAEAQEIHAQLVVAYHPPIFAPIKALTQADPRHRTLLQAIGSGLAIYSPHTALDAAPEGLCDWLADGLGAGQRVDIGSLPAGDPVRGPGRLVELDQPAALDALVGRIKKHLGLESLRVAAARPHLGGVEIHRVAVCAGSGGGVVSATDAQLWLTGEMRHHDVLAAVEEERSVILCEHTNTERGYLPRLRDRLRALLGRAVRVEVSTRDAEPLQRR